MTFIILNHINISNGVHRVGVDWVFKILCMPLHIKLYILLIADLLSIFVRCLIGVLIERFSSTFEKKIISNPAGGPNPVGPNPYGLFACTIHFTLKNVKIVFQCVSFNNISKILYLLFEVWLLLNLNVLVYIQVYLKVLRLFYKTFSMV